MTDWQYDVFISYGTKDGLDQARALYDGLTAKGWRIWWDKLNIRLGEAWPHEIKVGIDQARTFIFLMSPHATREESVCHNEIEHALNKGTPFLPIKIAECALPLRINTRQYIDLREGTTRALGLIDAWLRDEALPRDAWRKHGEPPYVPPKVQVPRNEWLDHHFTALLRDPLTTPRIHLISAPPGTGKTNVLRQLQTRAQHQEDYTVLFVGAAGTAGINRLPAEAIPALCEDLWAQLHPFPTTEPYWQAVTSAPTTAEPLVAQRSQWTRLKGALQARSRVQPLLLLLDDLHLAADAPFLRWLMSCCKGVPLQVVATFRQDDLSPLPKSDEFAYKLHPLPALQVRDVAKVLQPPDFAFGEHVLLLGDGQPRLIRALLEDWANEGVLTLTDGRWKGQTTWAELPFRWQNDLDTVVTEAETLLENYQQSHPDAPELTADDVIELLTAAAVAGDSFSFDELEGVFAEGGWDADQMTLVLDHLCQTHPPLLRPHADTPRYAFPTSWWRWTEFAYRWWLLSRPDAHPNDLAYYGETLGDYLEEHHRLPVVQWHQLYDLAQFSVGQRWRALSDPRWRGDDALDGASANEAVQTTRAWAQWQRLRGYVERETRIALLRNQLAWLAEEGAPLWQTYPLWQALGEALEDYASNIETATAYRTAREQAAALPADGADIAYLYFLEAFVSPAPEAVELLQTGWQRLPQVGAFAPNSPEARAWLAQQQTLVARATTATPMNAVLRVAAILLGRWGDLYRAQRRGDEALPLFNAALLTFQALPDPRNIALTQNRLGYLYVQQGREDEALPLYQSALLTFQALHDPRDIAITQVSLGDLYRQQGRGDEALACYQAALLTSQALPDPRDIAITQRSLGDLYRDQGRGDEALPLFNAALLTFQSLHDPHEIAVTQSRLGALYVEQGRGDEALPLLNAALLTFQALHDPHAIAATQSRLGDLYRQQGRGDEALAFYQAALVLVRQYDSPQEIKLLEERIATVLQK